MSEKGLKNATGAHIGSSYDKIDAPNILSGIAAYTEDFIPANALCIKCLRSPHAAAKIIDINTDMAKKVPGVEAIFTYKDVPQNRYTLAGQSFPEPSPYDHLILDQIVRYVNDEVAIVVAVDEKTANKALNMIKVKYEVYEPVNDARTALDHTTIVHPEDDLHYNFPMGGDPKRNIACAYSKVVGDVDKELTACDYILEEEFFCQATQQSMMEPFKSFCNIDQFGRLVCTSSTQVPFHVRRHIARALGIPATQIRVIKPRIGGGFGAKQTACVEIINAFVTWRLKKPSYLIYDRHETANCSTSRHARHWKVRLGATKDGIIQVIDMQAVSDAGAYGSHALTTFSAGEHKSIPLYNKGKAIRYESKMMYTNHMPGGAFRGYGATEALWALECAVNMLARKMNVDAAEIRRLNLIEEGETSLAFHPDEILDSGYTKEAVDKVKKMSGWDERPHGWDIDERYRGGLGMAVAFQGSGIANIDNASVEIKLRDDGFYTLYTGSTDMGQGSNTVLAQIACEILECDMQAITVYEADTDVVPFDPGSYASSTTYVTGTATKMAAEQLRQRIMEQFAVLLETNIEDITFDGNIATTLDGAKSMSLAQLAAKMAVGPTGKQLHGFATWGSHTSPPPFMASVAEVKVDKLTGKVTPIKFYSVVDSGTLINPKLAKVQVEGGIVQGIGMALYEDVRYTKAGRLETNNFMLYKVPTRMDMGEIEVDFVYSYEPTSGNGQKSIGEVVINTSSPAIQDAIANAVGVELTDLPMTPEKVFMAMQANKNK